MISDKTAYRRYLDGEEKAADLLVERYGDALTLYINGYIKDIHEAEDLMIEAFSQLFAKERPIEGEGSFKAYLYKIARHLALRHKQKHRLVFLCLDELDFEPRSDSLAETAMLRSERDRQLYDALEKLKAEYREALYLVYFEDMSYRNAATVMNKSESQITKLVYRGKQSLKVILEQEGFTYADKQGACPPDPQADSGNQTGASNKKTAPTGCGVHGGLPVFGDRHRRAYAGIDEKHSGRRDCPPFGDGKSARKSCCTGLYHNGAAGVSSWGLRDGSFVPSASEI